MDEALQRFQQDGYLQLHGFFGPERLEELSEQLALYIEKVVPWLPGSEAFYEQKGEAKTLKQLPRMGQHFAFFDRLLRQSELRELAERLLEDEVTPKDVAWFNKPARIGDATPPHQDGHYFMLEPNEALTFWIPLDIVDEENGCVRYIPGSHRQGLRPHTRSNTLGFSQHIDGYDEADRAREVAMPAVPGDMLVHHSLTIHRASPNRSDRHRPAMGLIYYAARAREDTAAKQRYLDTLNTELSKAGKI